MLFLSQFIEGALHIYWVKYAEPMSLPKMSKYDLSFFTCIFFTYFSL